MTDFIEILKYTVPSLVVLAIAYYMLKSFSESNKRSLEALIQLFQMQQQKQQAAAPEAKSGSVDLNRLQLQAFERMTLFLERINPVNLVPRVLPSAQTAGQLQIALIQSVREEYEHNMSQQIYLSDAVWEQIKAAKEHVIQTVNRYGGQTDPAVPAIELGQKILTAALRLEKNPVEETVRLLKAEVKKKTH